MKIVLLIILAISCSIQSAACEFCGCSAGNYFISPLPQFTKSFLGTRYTFRRFNTTLLDDPTQFSKDFYQSIEIWGGVNLGTKWQVMGFLPYAINEQNSDDGISRTQGLGDLTLLSNYKILAVKSGETINHALWIGGGLKLPMGKFNLDPDNIVASASNQPGSGSLDYLINALYSFSSNSIGFNANLNYKINQSADGFQFGNRLTASTFVYHSLYSMAVTFNPNVGMIYENLAANKQNDSLIDYSGGYTLLGVAGLETRLKTFAVGMNFQFPVSQKLSAGQTSTLSRGMLHVTYIF